MKIKIVISVILLFFSIFKLSSQEKLILEENFNDFRNVWPCINESSTNSKSELLIKQGKYAMSSFYDGTYMFTIPVSISQENDFQIESTLTEVLSKESNYEYGILWGLRAYHGYANTYLFSINLQLKKFGVFAITGTENSIEGTGKWRCIVNFTESSAIKQGYSTNKLGIKKKDDQYSFIINDVVVAKAPFQEFFGNEIGFLCEKVSIIADNIIVTETSIKKESDKKDSDKNESDKKEISKDESEWSGNGTGFFIDKRGYIATNYHVIEDATDIEIDMIKDNQKQSFKAKVISSDKQNDLAIIKIVDVNFNSFTKLPYSIKTNISDVGANIFTLGYPMALGVMGDEVKFTDGRISSKTGFQNNITIYQISAPVQPGNSGGPLFDFDGNIIGIVNSKIMKADNVSYAIKSTYLKNLIDVIPDKLILPNDPTISQKTLTEKIKVLSNYVVLIKIR